jgi:8-oxo-dGTP pyrophosphatase MutT (NUDIX family)
MDFDFINEKIFEAFANPLPGEKFQYEMAPTGRPKNNIYTENEIVPKESGVMVMIYPKNNISHLVLTQRHHYKGVHSGQVSLPGGKKENSDFDLWETAKRETFEEIGVSDNKLLHVGKLSDLYIPVSNFLVSPYVSIHHEYPQFKIQEKEVDSIIELPLETLLKEEISTQKIITVMDGIKMQVPCFEIDNKIIWGATAMILSEFKAILKNIKQNR